MLFLSLPQQADKRLAQAVQKHHPTAEVAAKIREDCGVEKQASKQTNKTRVMSAERCLQEGDDHWCGSTTSEPPKTHNTAASLSTVAALAQRGYVPLILGIKRGFLDS